MICNGSPTFYRGSLGCIDLKNSSGFPIKSIKLMKTAADIKQQRAIIVGASSGIGRELAKVLAREGYIVGVTARRTELLDTLQMEMATPSFQKRMDVALPLEAAQILRELIDEMGGLDLIVISAGVGYINEGLALEKELQTIDTNVSGFTAMANVAIRHFIQHSSGHLVAISSIAALRGNGEAPAYSASKAFMSNYMEGLQQKIAKMRLTIAITDVKPGFVDTPMAQGKGLFWVASAPTAAGQIYDAIRARKSSVYITRRWRLIAWLLRILPGWLYRRF